MNLDHLDYHFISQNQIFIYFFIIILLFFPLSHFNSRTFRLTYSWGIKILGCIHL